MLRSLAASSAGASIEVVEPVLDVAEAELLERVRDAVPRNNREGDRAYVGSTSDPAWRRIGGWSWGRESYMDGHRWRWRRLVVLGAWPDAEAGDMEVAAIGAARGLLGASLANKAQDARGLAVRGQFAHSFVYICVGANNTRSRLKVSSRAFAFPQSVWDRTSIIN